MRILVTGSTGHLGEALMRTLAAQRRDASGLDLRPSPYTTHVGSIGDRALLRRALAGVDAVLHTATLHKPHVATHPREAFVATNVAGTLALLEESVAAGVRAFVCTSTTSVYGHAMAPPPGAPAAWVDEDLVPQPRNIYGATKLAAEQLCELVARDEGLPCVVLRTGRFFPEDDDQAAVRDARAEANQKLNELLHRRADLADVVDAHLRALERAPALRFARYVVSATTPFARADAAALRHDPAAVVRRCVPGFEREYARRGWSLPESIDRVYDNARARAALDWSPRHDFAGAIARLRDGVDFRSELARAVGAKGYHERSFAQGPYPV